MQQYSNLGSLSRFTFDNLNPQGRSLNPTSQEQFSRAYKAAQTFANEPKGWLALVGPSGCGKTHLAAAIANQRLSRGHPAFFISTPDLLDHLRSAFSPNSEIAYDEFFDQVRNAPLLVLDDLGAQTSTPWAKEKLDQLLNHRFNSELPTVIVAIVPIEQLDERIRTRLTDPKLSRVYALEEKQPSPLEYAGALELELPRSMTFDNFDWRRVNLLPEQRQNLETAYRLALDFAKSPDGWLVFMGVTGCGKTHLAAARWVLPQPVSPNNTSQPSGDLAKSKATRNASPKFSRCSGSRLARLRSKLSKVILFCSSNSGPQLYSNKACFSSTVYMWQSLGSVSRLRILSSSCSIGVIVTITVGSSLLKR